MNIKKHDLNSAAKAEAEDYTKIIKDDDICTNIKCRIYFAVAVSITVILVITLGILYLNT